MQKNISEVNNIDTMWVEHGYGNRFQGFQNLMQIRVRDILIVSSLYDLYLFEEDGRLYELIRNEYQGLSLSHSPELTRVSSGMGAINLAKKENRFDLIITTLHIEDMPALQFAKEIKAAGLNIPVVLLAFDNKELKEILFHKDVSVFDKIFIWQGDFRIIITIIKYFEDRLNVDNDIRMAGIQSIIVVEDSIKDYSSFLPILYSEFLNQSLLINLEGINLTHRFLRMRARPKILLCSTYEEAWQYYSMYKDFILGIISDVDYLRDGKQDKTAGIEFVKNIRNENPEIPVLLQSHIADNQQLAESVGASFLLKNSSLFLNELREFINNNFGFGDFIFRTPDGKEINRAENLKIFEEKLQLIPEESFKYHTDKNHFSTWLKSRTEFSLAHKFNTIKQQDFGSYQALRKKFIVLIHDFRMNRHRGIITDFSKETFDPDTSFARIGTGSIGGKARGLGFVNTILNDYNIRNKFEDIIIEVPSAVVLGTGIFDQFMSDNNLRSFAMECADDKEITKKFLGADKFPEGILAELAAFLDIVKVPLAVRSSSLLEDSQYHSFAGVYETYMIPNKHSNPLARLNELIIAIKKVFASAFYQSAKNYIKTTSYRLEEEKMAVIVQKIVGNKFGSRFYPNISGVAKSYNFYPVNPQKSEDGIVAAALGLGKIVVDGGIVVRFCPKYPADLIQFNSIKETLNNTQHDFFALDMNYSNEEFIETYDTQVTKYNLKDSEADGTLSYVGSTYSPDNNSIYEGISRNGVRLVTLSPVLRHKIFPLPQILELLMDMGTWGMGTPVEIEFAVNLNVNPKVFGLVQMRPLVLSREVEELDPADVSVGSALCRSSRVLGYGIIKDVYDIVLVDYNIFDRSKSHQVAEEISSYNYKLLSEGKPYLLIGVGRWGSLDPWLGIPVTWEQIAGAKVIVETGLKDISVEPSQGSHFFHNITSFSVGYFTVNQSGEDDFIEWDWLLNRKPTDEKKYTRLLSFKNPLIIKMNGRANKGIILKPEE